MFGKNNQTTENGSVNLIGNGTTIDGDINSKGDVRIDGILNGNLITNGKFVLGASGKINGDVNCSNADIMGEINGKLGAQELLILKHSAKINGDINTGKIAIEVGAIFSGNCNMGAVVKNINQPKTAKNEITQTA
ncbi:MAG: polymer-forming cytoskeletal protein [Bacteroidetes bacterium]|nr:polymer-forming cytoskeletal protein [Bacteroidota bacterium]